MLLLTNLNKANPIKVLDVQLKKYVLRIVTLFNQYDSHNPNEDRQKNSIS